MQDMIMISVKWWNHVNLKAFQETDYFWAEKTVGNFTNYSWSQWRWLWLKLHVWLHACNLFRSILGKPAPAWLNGFSWESSQIHTEWDFIKVEFKLGECYPAHWLIFNSFLLTKSLNCQDSGGTDIQVGWSSTLPVIGFVTCLRSLEEAWHLDERTGRMAWCPMVLMGILCPQDGVSLDSLKISKIMEGDD